MEDPNELLNTRVQRKIADIGQKNLEKKLQLTDPEKKVRAEILLEIINHKSSPFILETRTKKIGSTIFPIKESKLPWAYRVPLYKISRNLAVFEADLIDSQRNFSTVYIALAKDTDLSSNTVTVDILDPRDFDDVSNAKSEDIQTGINYKVVVEIPQEAHDNPSITIRSYEKSPKGSLIQRVISGSGINKN